MKFSAVLSTFAAVALGIQAQTGLSRADAVLHDSFTNITAVRVFADGRVLLYDAGEGQLVIGNFSTGRSRPVGRRGAGPQEYGEIGALVALAGDSTLAVDMSNRRWMLLAGDRIVSMISQDHPTARAGLIVLGATERGLVLSASRVASIESTPNGAVHIALRVTDRTTGAGDEVARLAGVAIRQEVVSRNPDGSPSAMRSMPELLAAPEQALLFVDGWIAVVRLAPYRVEWRDPEGSWIRGQPLVVARLAVTAREKQAYADRLSKRMGRKWDPASTTVWASEVAPIESANALLALDNGTLLIGRSPNSATPLPSYDIVDRTGALIRRLETQGGRRVVGAGAGTLISVIEDPDGLQRLELHRRGW